MTECLNGGVLISRPASNIERICLCNKDFIGPRCEINLMTLRPEEKKKYGCELRPCWIGSTCEDRDGSFICHCSAVKNYKQNTIYLFILFTIFYLRIHLENFVKSLHWPTLIHVLVSLATIMESVLSKIKILIRVRATLHMVGLDVVKTWLVHAPPIRAKEMDFVNLSV